MGQIWAGPQTGHTQSKYQYFPTTHAATFKEWGSQGWNEVSFQGCLNIWPPVVNNSGTARNGTTHSCEWIKRCVDSATMTETVNSVVWELSRKPQSHIREWLPRNRQFKLWEMLQRVESIAHSSHFLEGAKLTEIIVVTKFKKFLKLRACHQKLLSKQVFCIFKFCWRELPWATKGWAANDNCCHSNITPTSKVTLKFMT